MCVVSNVGDDWSRKSKWPVWPPQIPFPNRDPFELPISIPEDNPTFLKSEIARLRKQVEQMKAELEAAKAQDIAEGNEDCEMEEKVIILKKIAKMFDIELNEVFPE